MASFGSLLTMAVPTSALFSRPPPALPNKAPTYTRSELEIRVLDEILLAMRTVLNTMVYSNYPYYSMYLSMEGK